jgi:CheY-like chemotaxis protein
LLNYLRERTERDQPDLILLDAYMPRKDGFETLKEIKANEGWRQMPVVVFTSSRFEKDVKRCYELGANTVVQKPDSFEEFAKVIKGICRYWFNR